MSIKIALAGNPNCGKTTLFNNLTGSSQYVGNWPGVTVEKKEGHLKGRKDVFIQDLPGIYSLSPYTLEEVVARSYLVDEKPDAILNIVDGTGIERNLYLTTQLIELGIPVVVAVNMMDLVRKNGDEIDLKKLEQALGCRFLPISALKGEGCLEAADAAVSAAEHVRSGELPHVFTGSVEHALAHIEESIEGKVEPRYLRWYAIKLFERDEKVMEKLQLPRDLIEHLEKHIADCEKELDDDAESIITNQRYTYINDVITKSVTKKAEKHSLSTSDRIDRVVTNRILALPIFICVMTLIYAIAMGGLPVSIGTRATDWANDGLFGDGWFISGGEGYEDDAGAFEDAQTAVEAYLAAAEEKGIDTAPVAEMLESGENDESVISAFLAETGDLSAEAYFYDDEAGETSTEIVDGALFRESLDVPEPDPAAYGTWINGIPVVVGNFLESIGCNEVLSGLILDGIIGGVGAVLGFVPQMLVLFLLLSILEDVGYMARIAFIMDRIFRKFGLSGKSFIPMLVGTGCGVPGVMASRTIENERDRRMTIMTTCFIPCGAKMPIIALFAGALFGGNALVATSAYFIGVAAIVISGIILKKTRAFAGEPAPFVMELPQYHIPSAKNVLRATWERGWSFIKRAGTIILVSSIILWFLQGFGFTEEGFGLVESSDASLLAALGSAIAFIFAPLGFGTWQATVATITGLIAKEEVVSTFGVLYPGNLSREIAEHFTEISAYSFMVFNLLCAPCFAAIGAIKREMNNTKWTLGAIGYMCGFAYVIALIVYQLGSLLSGGSFGIGTVAALAAVAAIIWLLFRKGTDSAEYTSTRAVEAAK
ncbi:MAG: ferrous iron transport protein B [Clostridium sp.]|nr:ferrous iron transport protein B [Clostridium sp.]